MINICTVHSLVKVKISFKNKKTRSWRKKWLQFYKSPWAWVKNNLYQKVNAALNTRDCSGHAFYNFMLSLFTRCPKWCYLPTTVHNKLYEKGWWPYPMLFTILHQKLLTSLKYYFFGISLWVTWFPTSILIISGPYWFYINCSKLNRISVYVLYNYIPCPKSSALLKIIYQTIIRLQQWQC